MGEAPHLDGVVNADSALAATEMLLRRQKTVSREPQASALERARLRLAANNFHQE
jgi:hypothetical protein